MSAPAAPPSTGKPVSGQSALASWLPTIIMNIVLPTATYFILTQAGHLGDVPALLISGIWPLGEITYTVGKQRHVDEFSVFVLIGIVVGVITTMFSGDARAVFLKDSITTGLIGLIMLATVVFGRPLTFYLGRRFATDGSQVQRSWWNGLWRYPQFRRLQRMMGVVWGVALFGEAAVRAVLTLTLGTSAMVVVNNVVPYVIIAGLIFFSITVGRRAQAAAARRGVATGPPVATSGPPPRP
ncbi:MAG: VC0807 family protein [Pseudonocardiaceae bacterium]